MINGLLVDVEGTLSTVRIDDTNTITRLQSMREAIGCGYVEVLPMSDGVECWVDEEGLYNAEFNPVLTRMANRSRYTSPLLGAGLFLGGADATGATVSLTREQMGAVTRWWIQATTRIAAEPATV